VVAATILPSGIPSGEIFGSPVISPGLVVILPSGVPSAEAFGTPFLQFAAGIVLEVVGIESAEVFGQTFLRGGEIPLTLKKRIHDALMQEALAGTFIEVTYTPEGDILNQGLQTQPSSIEVNELTSRYRVDRHKGRGLETNRVGWQWLLILRFDQEVIAEVFEENLQLNPPCVRRLMDGDQERQAVLLMLDCDYIHPPRGAPSNGTELRYRFEALLSPK